MHYSVRTVEHAIRGMSRAQPQHRTQFRTLQSMIIRLRTVLTIL